MVTQLNSHCMGGGGEIRRTTQPVQQKTSRYSVKLSTFKSNRSLPGIKIIINNNNNNNNGES